MQHIPGTPAESAYRLWLNREVEPGWYEPGEGHRIQTAFIAGWVEGVTYLAAELAAAWSADPHLVELVEALKDEGARQAPPPGPSPG